MSTVSFDDELHEEDLDIYVYRGPGIGGQVVYEARAYCPAVRIAYRPTGAEVTVSARTLLDAKRQALDILHGIVRGYITVKGGS